MIMIISIIKGGLADMCACRMRKGQRAVISSVDTKHAAAARLVEMGFTPGSVLEVIGSSPFGDPVMMKLRGYTIAVRKSDLTALEVKESMEA